jgi:uroporphyrinogen-III synthase
MSETSPAPGGALSGARIGILEGRMTSELARLVERHGGVPVLAPALREVKTDAGEPVATLVQELAAGRVDIVIFMTGVGAAALFAEAERQGKLDDLVGALQHTTNVTRGQKPWRPMKERGVPISVSAPSPYTTDELLATLADVPMQGKGVALLHYGERSEPAAQAVRDAGGNVLELCLYEWQLPDDTTPIESLIREVIAGQITAVLVTSKVQARHLMEVAERIGLADELVESLNTTTVVGAVGPTSAQELLYCGIEPRVVPDNPKMGPLIVALGEHLRSSRAA